MIKQRWGEVLKERSLCNAVFYLGFVKCPAHWQQGRHYALMEDIPATKWRWTKAGRNQWGRRTFIPAIILAFSLRELIEYNSEKSAKILRSGFTWAALCSLLPWVFPEVSSSKLQNTQLIKTVIETHSLMLVFLSSHDQQSGVNMIISHSLHYFL